MNATGVRSPTACASSRMKPKRILAATTSRISAQTMLLYTPSSMTNSALDKMRIKNTLSCNHGFATLDSFGTRILRS